MTETQSLEYVQGILADLNSPSYFYPDYVENVICNYLKREGIVITPEEAADVRQLVFSHLQQSFPGCY